MSQREPWIVDLEDPRAPPLEIWEQLSPEQRARVVDSLPLSSKRVKRSRPRATLTSTPK